MKTRQKKVAFFDIDGTIFRSSLLIELVDALIKEGIFTPGVAKRYEREERKWRDRKGDYETYIMSVVHAFRKAIKGVRYADFARVANKVVRRKKDRVYRYTRDLVRDLKKKNYYLVAISHSPRTIVGPFAERLGFDKVYGLFYEIDEKERFKGTVLYADLMFNKGDVVRRVLEKHGLTLKGSIGVGDTESDIPFLKLVSRPICFNPNQKLLRAAKRHGWTVVVERKDVVYEM